jgi:hypothetical protein
MYQNYTPNHSAVKVSGSADDTPFAISLNSLASTGRFYYLALGVSSSTTAF